MRIVQIFREVRIQVRALRFPVVMREAVRVASKQDCESVLGCLCGFWTEITHPLLPIEFIEYKNALLKYLVRTQQKDYVRMVHKIMDSEFLIDALFYFDYDFAPYDSRNELAKVDEAYLRIPTGSLLRNSQGILPFHFYDTNTDPKIAPNLYSRVDPVRHSDSDEDCVNFIERIYRKERS